LKRPHHIAALLAGWFLMVSPLTKEWPWHPVADAPLEHYYNKHDLPFASKQDCEIDKQHVILHAKNSSALNDTYFLGVYYWMLLQCVPADDPRMKEK
jgi:hypothetical protein